MRVNSLDAEELCQRDGVTVFEYNGMPMDGDIADQPVLWSAWFKDTEGNIIGVIQEK